jgi:Leucine-rich repeat (LRR) protein
MKRTTIFAAALALTLTAMQAADAPHWIETLGGHIVRGPDGAIVEASVARTWATDADIVRIAEIKTLKKLDLSHTYASDRSIEKLPQLQQLEELILDTCEFITDASLNYLRANKNLKRLVLRGTDVTDVGMPHLAQLTGLKRLDISHSMLGDVGLESLSALVELEELNLGGNLITGMNLNSLKLLPKLKKLSFHGIQRRNAGACWSPRITDLDLDTISLLSNLEELDLGIGISLGRVKPTTVRGAEGGGNCRVTGGIQMTDLGLAKLTKLKKLRRLDVSGAQLTPEGIKVLASLPQLERLSLWNCVKLDDSAAEALAAMPKLANLDLSNTLVGDKTLERLAALPNLKFLYLTDTKVTPEAVASFRKKKSTTFVSFARRPEPPPEKAKPAAKPPDEFANE